MGCTGHSAHSSSTQLCDGCSTAPSLIVASVLLRICLQALTGPAPNACFCRCGCLSGLVCGAGWSTVPTGMLTGCIWWLGQSKTIGRVSISARCIRCLCCYGIESDSETVKAGTFSISCTWMFLFIWLLRPLQCWHI